MKTQITTGSFTATETAVNSKLMKFFVDQLQDMYWAEQKLVRTLPKLGKAATSEPLKNAFNDHLTQTKLHVSRLENVFDIIGEKVSSSKCLAMSGIIDEAQDIIDDTEDGTAQRDAGLIFAGQKVEHYEIGTYGGLISVAQTLGYNEAADQLRQTLNEEKAADNLLTHLAEEDINFQASKELVN